VTQSPVANQLTFDTYLFFSSPDYHQVMASQIPRGAFIVFEGCDRSGKTTQAKKLVDYLNKNNIPSQFVNFPDRTISTGN
jgi:Thymidylate kinase